MDRYFVGGETGITLKIPNPRCRVYKNSNLVSPVSICIVKFKNYIAIHNSQFIRSISCISSYMFLA